MPMWTSKLACTWLINSFSVQEKGTKETGGVGSINEPEGFTKSTMKPLKRSRDTHFQSDAG